MEFTYSGYSVLIELLKKCDYQFADYENYHSFNKCVILRHDVDYDLQKSFEFAKLENKLGIKSTYFVLVTSDFYNIFSKHSIQILKQIASLGHNLGLHFDEMNYPDIIGNVSEIESKILFEANLLESAIQKPVNLVSMHRPSKATLESNLAIPGMINSYSDEFFHNFKYLSDSRRNWSEPAEDIIKSGRFERLHILTHAFWYKEEEEDIAATIKSFINNSKYERYDNLNDNIRDLNSIILKEDL